MNGKRGYERDALTYEILAAAYEVHTELGAGMQEKHYENALCIELAKRNLRFERQPPMQVTFKSHNVGDIYPDIVVENQVILELKAVAELADIHKAQLASYLNAAGMRRGLLINFNVVSLKNGIKRVFP